MKYSLQLDTIQRVTLCADTAADLMTPNPVSVRAEATLREALALLVDRAFSAAPVIDEAGRPVGVLSRSDLLVHAREEVRYARPAELYRMEELTTPAGERLSSAFQVESVDRTQVRDAMTPGVFAVSPETSAAEVVRELLAFKVHRVFVVDVDGVLVGVISTFDVLRHLKPDES
jgi:CBS-domain-containing membrane protein